MIPGGTYPSAPPVGRRRLRVYPSSYCLILIDYPVAGGACQKAQERRETDYRRQERLAPDIGYDGVNGSLKSDLAAYRFIRFLVRIQGRQEKRKGELCPYRMFKGNPR